MAGSFHGNTASKRGVRPPSASRALGLAPRASQVETLCGSLAMTASKSLRSALTSSSSFAH